MRRYETMLAPGSVRRLARPGSRWDGEGSARGWTPRCRSSARPSRCGTAKEPLRRRSAAGRTRWRDNTPRRLGDVTRPEVTAGPQAVPVVSTERGHDINAETSRAGGAGQLGQRALRRGVTPDAARAPGPRAVSSSAGREPRCADNPARHRREMRRRGETRAPVGPSPMVGAVPRANLGARHEELNEGGPGRSDLISTTKQSVPHARRPVLCRPGTALR